MTRSPPPPHAEVARVDRSARASGSVTARRPFHSPLASHGSCSSRCRGVLPSSNTCPAIPLFAPNRQRNATVRVRDRPPAACPRATRPEAGVRQALGHSYDSASATPRRGAGRGFQGAHPRLVARACVAWCLGAVDFAGPVRELPVRPAPVSVTGPGKHGTRRRDAARRQRCGDLRPAARTRRRTAPEPRAEPTFTCTGVLVPEQQNWRRRLDAAGADRAQDGQRVCVPAGHSPGI
jgi:hypothetical protein